MLGKTHMAAGITVCMCLMQPATEQGIVLGTGAAAIGAVISDIDAGKSTSRKESDKVFGLAALVLAAMVAADRYWNLRLQEMILQDSGLLRIATGALGFLLICVIGQETPHRSFMHSFLAMMLLSACVSLIYEPASVPFGIGFFSHLILDLLNKKGVRLFYPVRFGFKLGFCSSNGLIDRLLFGICTVLSTVMIGFLLLKIKV